MKELSHGCITNDYQPTETITSIEIYNLFDRTLYLSVTLYSIVVLYNQLN